MNRHSSVLGIVLKSRRIGEIHREVTLFTREEGLKKATAYGACKGRGKLAAAANLFCAAEYELYEDPTKGGIKITEASVRSEFPSFRSSLVKYSSAVLFARILLLCESGINDSKEIFSLLAWTLKLLDESAEPLASRITVLFLWRLILLMGLGFPLDHCQSCRRAFGESEDVFFNSSDQGLCCAECSKDRLGLKVSDVSRAYLRAGEDMPIGRALSLPLERLEEDELLALFYEFFSAVLEKPIEDLVFQAGGRG
jgi:DNA repair protein RecO (recombination protein O)